MPAAPDETVTTVERFETYTETILEMADGQPCKVRRVYGRCGDIFNNDRRVPSYSLRTLLFERPGAEDGPAPGEKVRITVEGGSRPEDKRERTPEEWQALLTDDDRRALEAEADFVGDLLDVLSLPKDPVAVGGGWEVHIHQAVGRAAGPGDPNPDGSGDPADDASLDFFPVPGKRAVTLQQVDRREGRPFAVLEVVFSGGPKSFTVTGPNGLGGGLGAPGGPGAMDGSMAAPPGSLSTVEEKGKLEFPIDGPTTGLTVTATEKTTAKVGGAVVFQRDTVRRYERSGEPSPD
jgi:hypothetical protein